MTAANSCSLLGEVHEAVCFEENLGCSLRCLLGGVTIGCDEAVELTMLFLRFSECIRSQLGGAVALCLCDQVLDASQRVALDCVELDLTHVLLDAGRRLADPAHVVLFDRPGQLEESSLCPCVLAAEPYGSRCTGIGSRLDRAGDGRLGDAGETPRLLEARVSAGHVREDVLHGASDTPKLVGGIELV